MRSAFVIALALLVTACGVQRPLIRPADIPAYEKSQREKRERMEQDQRELDAIDAKRSTAPAQEEE